MYAGKVKLIYIDPPYNTGNDSFGYNDSFNHSTWLTFMRNRLQVAKSLLDKHGVIFVQLDDKEHAYFKVLMDSVFGAENFKSNIVIKSSTESGVNAVNVKRGERLFKVKENLLFYTKSPDFRFKPFLMKAEFNKNYKFEVVKSNDTYSFLDKSKEFKSLEDYISYALSNPNSIYSLEKNLGKAGDKVKAFANQNKGKFLVEEFVNSHGDTALFYDGGVLVSLRERVLIENETPFFGVLASDLWLDIGTTASTEGGVAFKNGKKSEKLLQRLIESSTSNDDIVLDFHVGSGTTAAVAHKMGRQYIGIEQMDYIEDITLERMQKVIAGEQSGISKDVKWVGGGSFVYCELARANQAFIDEIQAATTTEQLQDIWQAMQARAFLSYQIDVKAFDANAGDFAALSFVDQQRFLIEVLDKNMLYVPLSEMDDAVFGITDNDKALNKQFFGL